MKNGPKEANRAVIEYPISTLSSDLVSRFAAAHVGKAIPKDMLLYPGGTLEWKPEIITQDKSFAIKIPQIFSFATAGWVIPFDTCARWNASPVTMIFPLKQVLDASITNVGPELMFLKPVQIPVALVNRDLIPEDSPLIQENKDKTKFLFYSGGKNETSLKLRREIVNQIMREMGYIHFEPMPDKFPIPSYNMRFYLNGQVSHYALVFKEYLAKHQVSFGWELYSIRGGADLFYRYQGILLQGCMPECIELTIFNLKNLHDRIARYLKRILSEDTKLLEKIECLLNDSEKLMQLLFSKRPDFSSASLQEALFYQWLEIFKNMSAKQFVRYREKFIESFLKSVSQSASWALIDNMNSLFHLVKHIEQVSPYLKRQLKGLVHFEEKPSKNYFGQVDLPLKLWKQFFKFYYCAPLDDEKISQTDVDSFKKELKESFAPSKEIEDPQVIQISFFKEKADELSECFSSLHLNAYLPVFSSRSVPDPKRKLHPMQDWFGYLNFSEEDWNNLINGRIGLLLAKTDFFYHSRVYALAVCQGFFQYINNMDEDGKRFAIECAARFGKKAVVLELLNTLPSDNHYHRLTMAFYHAIESGFFDIAEMLLRTSSEQISGDQKRMGFIKALAHEAYGVIEAMTTHDTLSEISHYTVFCQLSDALEANNAQKAEKLIYAAQVCLNTKELGMVLLQAARDNYYRVTEAYLRSRGNEVGANIKKEIFDVVEAKSSNKSARFVANMLRT